MTTLLEKPNLSLSVVIVSFNSGHWLKRAVRALIESSHLSGNLQELVVVDNASSDDSLDGLIDADPQVKVRIERLTENIGFGRAANVGWRSVDSDCVLVLNPDCVIDDGQLLRECLIALEDPSLGIVSTLLKNTDGSIQAPSLRHHPTPLRALMQASGVAKLMPAWGVNILYSKGSDPLLEVEACSGAFMMLRRETLQVLEGFDPHYFLHCEDLDLCRRTAQIGLKTRVHCRYPVLHDKGTSSRAVPELVLRAKHAGMRRYFEKFDAATTPKWLATLLMWGLDWQLARGLKKLAARN